VRLLLDTHSFIWWDSAPDRLPEATRVALSDPANEVLLSVVVLWEMQIKRTIGKLELRAPLEALIEDQEANGVSVLPVTLQHVLALGALPLHHRDPFDRLLVAQAQVEEALLVTRDSALADYPVKTLW
jgi:PIN domain nuclease of toxin-antitoxin system